MHVGMVVLTGSEGFPTMVVVVQIFWMRVEGSNAVDISSATHERLWCESCTLFHYDGPFVA